MTTVLDDWGLPTPEGLRRQEATRARLAAIVAAMQAAHDRTTRTAAWIPALTLAEEIAEFAAADEGACAALLLQASTVPGMADAVASVRRRVDRTVAAWRKRMDALDRAAVSPSGLGEAARPEGLPAACTVPEPYAISSAGVWRRVVTDEAERIIPVCSAPLYVVGRSVDVASGDRWLDLAWPDDGGGWCSQLVSRASASDSRGIVALAQHGAPVHSGNAREVVPYIAALEQDWRDHLPLERVSSRCGWVGRGALVGGAWHGPGALRLRAPHGMEDLLGAVRAGGSLGGWVDLWRGASHRPIPVLAVYAAAASMLLQPMGATGAVLDIWGRTTGGKTVALSLAASVWGAPPDLVRQWDATPTWMERAAEALGSLPVLLDDTRQVKEKERANLPQRVYNHVFGVGRGRGSVEGVQRQSTWLSWLLSTGESPILQGGGNDGARARVLSIEGAPFGSRAEAIRVEVGVTEHYGHVGPLLVAWAVEHLDALPGMYAERRDAWAKASAGIGSIAQRLSATVAGLEVAAIILHDHLGIPAPACDPWAVAMAALGRAEVGADQPLAAWRMVHARASANGLSWWGRGDDKRDPPGGWLGAWPMPAMHATEEPPMAILPHVLRGWLADDGHDPDATLAEWGRRRWVEGDGAHRTRPRVVGASRPRCVCMTSGAMAVVGREEEG